MIKGFKCGFCKDENIRSRNTYRKHLKEHVRNKLFNTLDVDKRLIRQNWVIEVNL